MYFFRRTGKGLISVHAFDVNKNQKDSGFPKRITDVFPAVVPNDHPAGNLDAVYFSYTQNSVVFFKGMFYWKAVDNPDRLKNPSLPYNGLMPRQNVANQWYDICNVHAFDVNKNQKDSGFPKRITDVFPAVVPNDHPAGNLDAVYFSYTQNSVVFFKGMFYWKAVDNPDRLKNPSLPYNGLMPRQNVANQWYDICNVHSSVLKIKS
ncbi:UNVERIFIED_CONTAM: hypothetical protein FKN15_037545 [Acipenser sinensis]